MIGGDVFGGDGGVVVQAMAAGFELTSTGTVVHTYTGAVQSTFYAELGHDATADITEIKAIGDAYGSADITISGPVRQTCFMASQAARPWGSERARLQTRCMPSGGPP